MYYRIAVAAVMLSLCGCTLKMISVDESSNGHEVTLQTGQVLKITLYENPSTGFRWILPNEPNCLRQSANEAEAPKGPPGQGGVRTFSFEAIRSGSGELYLEYRRSWEITTASARTFKLLVRVDK